MRKSSLRALFWLVPLLIFVALQFTTAAVEASLDGDYYIYGLHYEIVGQRGIREALDARAWEPLYGLTAWAFSASGFAFNTFLLAAAILLVGSYLAFARQVVGPTGAAFATALFLATPFYTSFSTIIIRQSLSFSILLLAGAALLSGRGRRAI